MSKKDIKGYEGLYAIDTMGNVWSLKQTTSRRKGILKPYVNTGGYLRVNLYQDKKCEHKYIHRLVAEAYIPNPNNYEVVNHKDADPQNNAVNNLEWCTQKYNIYFSRKMGNQNDIPVRAVNKITGEVLEFDNLKNAGVSLFDKWWALRYHQQKYGERFSFGDWDFEVIQYGVYTT